MERELQERIAALRQLCQERARQLLDLRKELDETSRRLQGTCEHVFVCEDNSDAHRPGSYYVCDKCQFVTMSRPSPADGTLKRSAIH